MSSKKIVNHVNWADCLRFTDFMLLNLQVDVLFLVRNGKPHLQKCDYVIPWWVKAGHHTEIRHCLKFHDGFLRNPCCWKLVIEFYVLLLGASDCTNFISSKLKGNSEKLYMLLYSSTDAIKCLPQTGQKNLIFPNSCLWCSSFKDCLWHLDDYVQWKSI